jgi:hypothetical protein
MPPMGCTASISSLRLKTFVKRPDGSGFGHIELGEMVSEEFKGLVV